VTALADGALRVLGGLLVFVVVAIVAWHIERAIRRRARAKRDREWYRAPPKRMPPKK
jgi:hypothetical protein